MLKRIINTIVWVVVSLYIILIILLHLPAIQGLMGSWTSDVLSKKLGTTVSIGRIDLGFVNRLIVDDICILDQKDKKMLKASRASTINQEKDFCLVDPTFWNEGKPV